MKVKDMYIVKRIINLILICSVSSVLYGSEQKPKVFSLKDDLLFPGLKGMVFTPMVIAIVQPTLCKKLIMEQPEGAFTIFVAGFCGGAAYGAFGYMKKPQLLSGKPSMQNPNVSKRTTTTVTPTNSSPLSANTLLSMKNKKIDYTKE